MCPGGSPVRGGSPDRRRGGLGATRGSAIGKSPTLPDTEVRSPTLSRCASSSTAEQRTLNPQVSGSNPEGRTLCGAPLGLDQGLCPFRNLSSSSVATGRGYHDNDQGAGRPRSGGDEGKASRRLGSARVRRAPARAAHRCKRKMVDSGTGHVRGIREAPEPLRRVSWHGGAPLSGGRARRDCRVLRGLTEYSPSEDSMPERPSALFRRLRGFRNEPTRRTNGQQ